jgi:hypothetical protein
MARPRLVLCLKRLDKAFLVNNFQVLREKKYKRAVLEEDILVFFMDVVYFSVQPWYNYRPELQALDGKARHPE